jgi:hypothetical protein
MGQHVPTNTLSPVCTHPQLSLSTENQESLDSASGTIGVCGDYILPHDRT